MTNWTIETMVYCRRGSKSGRAAADIFVGKRNSADGGKTWIAVGVLAEIGDLSRFQNPRELMG
ncbi:hypothetical protein [Bradyrhizobium stylosanthis]|uniref:Uncharacterized protein n=1 Tax=Bradyrhizobium stylosanthis TaxID=1803665 RepID=A0A560D4K4_9BRAD|nr:hypothetical protein [Bradyrhizobium stylosanthis]TWA92054.1 hypothetical protein FBZ96_11260 [Bradyrhizobium stylosanthis]